ALRDYDGVAGGGNGVFERYLNDVIFFKLAHAEDQSLRHALGIEADGILRRGEGRTGKVAPDAHPARLCIRLGRILNSIGQRSAGKGDGFWSLGGVTAGNFEIRREP